MIIEIETVENGYIIKSEEFTEVVELPETKEDSYEYCEAIQTLLYKITDYIGCHGSKHDEHRVIISVEKQN
jgi:hypothetical protein